MSVSSILFAYVFGGVTFLPLILFLFIYVHPKKAHQTPQFSETPETPETPQNLLKAGEIEESAKSGLDCFKQGWVFVTHEDIESQDELSSKTESVAEASDARSAYSSLYKLVAKSPIVEPQADNTGGTPTKNIVGISSISGGGLAENGGKNGTAAPPSKPSGASKKHRYYAVLKHGNLFLYRNEKLQDVRHVIVLAGHVVALWPRSVSEASLFTKHSSIAILKHDWSRPRRLSDNFDDQKWTSNSEKISIHDVLHRDSGLPAPPGTIFVHTDYNIDKEDWYFALIRASKGAGSGFPVIDPTVHAQTMHLETPSMMALIQRLYGSEGQLQSKWFNAIIGRVFLSLQRTDMMINYLTGRIERKLNKIKTPGFLDKFHITSVDAGTAAPTITFPVLKEINPQGDLLVSFNMHYAGGMAIQLATKANINLGSRFKSREVDLLLAVKLEKISGPMLIKIKAPPSARVWYTYEREPDLAIAIEPVISARQMSYNIITNTIEKKFKEAVRDSLVLPHWDDVSFCPAPDALYRGGVWENPSESARVSPDAVRDSHLEASATSHDPASETASAIGSAGTESDATSEVGIAEYSSTKTKTNTKGSNQSQSQSQSQKARVSKTLGDLSRRLRKPKSAHTLEVDATNCLADGSVMGPSKVGASEMKDSSSVDTISSASISTQNDGHTTGTLRRLGEWYSKGDKPASLKSSASTSSSAGLAYHPPEMITSRRPRKQSSTTMYNDVEKQTDGLSYDFAKIDRSNDVIQGVGSTSVRRQSSSKAKVPLLNSDEPDNVANGLARNVSADATGDTGFKYNLSSLTTGTEHANSIVSTELSYNDKFDDSLTSSLASLTKQGLKNNTTVGRKPPPELEVEEDVEHIVHTAPL